MVSEASQPQRTESIKENVKENFQKNVPEESSGNLFDDEVYIDANNQAVEVDAEYDEQTQCAVFSTDHFSTWYVDATASDSGSGGGSNVGLIIGIIVGVLVVAAIVAVVVLVKTGKIGGAKGAA